MSIVVVALPPELLAYTVYVVDGDTTVGVPEISPVDVSNDKPFGRSGVISQDVTVPPRTVGVSAVITESLVKVYGLPLYAIDDGMTSFTVIVIVVVVLPPVLVAVTV